MFIMFHHFLRVAISFIMIAISYYQHITVYSYEQIKQCEEHSLSEL